MEQFCLKVHAVGCKVNGHCCNRERKTHRQTDRQIVIDFRGRVNFVWHNYQREEMGEGRKRNHIIQVFQRKGEHMIERFTLNWEKGGETRTQREPDSCEQLNTRVSQSYPCELNFHESQDSHNSCGNCVISYLFPVPPSSASISIANYQINEVTIFHICLSRPLSLLL